MIYLLRWLFCWVVLGRAPKHECDHDYSDWAVTQSTTAKSHACGYSYTTKIARSCSVCFEIQEKTFCDDSYDILASAKAEQQREITAVLQQLNKKPNHVHCPKGQPDEECCANDGCDLSKGH